MLQKAKEFYEYQLNDNSSVVGRMDKEEIIELMAAFAEQQVKNLNIPTVMPSLPDKDVKITSEGLMKGNYWQIKITGIKDENLYDTEIAVLSLFGRKKQGQ